MSWGGRKLCGGREQADSRTTAAGLAVANVSEQVAGRKVGCILAGEWLVGYFLGGEGGGLWSQTRPHSGSTSCRGTLAD